MDKNRVCENCGQDYVPKDPRIRKPGAGRFCSKQCFGATQRRVNNDDGVSPYRTLARHLGHPLASKTGRVLEHRKVLFDSIGPGTHPCHWCQEPVTWTFRAYSRKGNLVVDHVDENRFNNKLSNLAPSCGPCNLRRSMRKLVKDDELFIVRTDGRRARATQRICVGCEAEFLVQSRTLRTGIPNRGIYCSLTCKNKNMPKARTP